MSDEVGPSVSSIASPATSVDRGGVGLALRGLRVILTTRRHAWMYPSVTVAVVVVGLSWRFGPGQWAMITCAIVAVWIAEALRSAVDRLCEGASPDLAPYLEEAKEVAAAAVLIASVGALVIVVLAVSPYLRAG